MPVELQEIYEAEAGDRHKTPLVLIHDGGGTVFQYYMLGYLGRTTYAIANPYFESGERPEGGLVELARQYAMAIKGTIEGAVILGGWSFGGMISMEIAQILRGSRTNALGLLMLDSYCPWAEGAWTDSKITPIFRDTTSERMKQLATTSFVNARAMIKEWKRPVAIEAPPTVIIRAEESRFQDGESDLLTRNDGKLGWSVIESLIILSVIDVPGNHFSMFEERRIDNLTKQIVTACSLFN